MDSPSEPSVACASSEALHSPMSSQGDYGSTLQWQRCRAVEASTLVASACGFLLTVSADSHVTLSEVTGALITPHLEHLDGLRHLLLLQEHGGLGQHCLIGQG